MFVSRQRRCRRVQSGWLIGLAGLPIAMVAVTQSAAASSVLGLPLGKNGLPATWLGEALTVALAFALPAVLAGLFVTARRATQRLGTRGVVLVATSAGVALAGAVAVEHDPSLLTHLTAWLAQ